ncbi:sigma-54 dependent transcriptional regulator [Pseudomonadota bacterium]|nr:sigma-54 dependent transcriptional regulator [Alphaproteobacteria bacterium]MDC1357226.1 sigma-54 dependent transcriptional regulator [Pseudomonadota bacterium]
MDAKNIIVVDDDRTIRVVISTALTRAGYNVKSSGTAAGMWRLVDSDFADILITDVGLPDGDALDVLPKLQNMKPKLKIIVMSARTTLLTAVRAKKKGAFEYLPKPFDLDELLNLVSSTFLLNNNHKTKVNEIKKSLKNIYDSGPVIGKSMAMQDIYKLISRLVNTNLTLLISGESGTGKNLIAKSIHDLSSFNNKLFITINMEFFDNYTLENFIQKLQLNNNENVKSFDFLSGCTIIINDLSESSLLQQKNLLSFIEEDFSFLLKKSKKFKKPRIIALTKKNILNEVDKGLFREDLFYRVNVVPIKLPLLKDRFEDIPDLTIYFLNKYLSNTQINRFIPHEGMNLLKNYIWPGNIRELKNVIKRICLLSSSEEIPTSLIKEVLSEDRLNIDEIEEDNVELYFKKYLNKFFKNFDPNLNINNLHTSFISKIEKPLIESTLHLFRGNQIKASKCLGFNRNTLRTKINLYKIKVIKQRKV